LIFLPQFILRWIPNAHSLLSQTCYAPSRATAWNIPFPFYKDFPILFRKVTCYHLFQVLDRATDTLLLFFNFCQPPSFLFSCHSALHTTKTSLCSKPSTFSLMTYIPLDFQTSLFFFILAFNGFWLTLPLRRDYFLATSFTLFLCEHPLSL
jgi:hypothetical protein